MTRGGKRKNSGRPFSQNRKIMYSTRLKIHQIEWLQKKRNATKTLEILIDEAIKKENDRKNLKKINDMKKISRFEYAILKTIQPEKTKDYEPFTEQEENKIRSDKIKNFFTHIRIKTNKTS